jgi:integrase
VKTYIANSKHANVTKNKLALAYTWFCKTNGLEWKQPYYKWERKVPLIPTTENVNKIIAATSRKYATIFTILAETGLEGHELSTTQRKDIDTEQGIITATGCKGHSSRSFRLKPQTAEMLRRYLSENTGNNPFPNAHALGEAWRDARNHLAAKLNEPQLKRIPMRNLRHRFATMKYDQTKDILLVKQLLGHKKLETTMFYTQLIAYNGDEEYTCKAATNVKEATELIEHGFQYVTEIDGLKLFKKRK